MMLNERRTTTPEQVATAQAFAAWKAERAAQPIPASRFPRECTLCGGTETGQSHRGFVGTCTCGVMS